MKHAAASREQLEIDDRDRLIRWLSNTFKYHDPTTGDVTFNDPTFPFFGIDGTALYESQMNFITWQVVVRGKTLEEATDALFAILEAK